MFHRDASRLGVQRADKTSDDTDNAIDLASLEGLKATFSLRSSYRLPLWSRCDRACFQAYKNDVYLLPNELDEEVAVAIMAQAISCSNVRCVFPASRAFLVLSCPSVYKPVL